MQTNYYIDAYITPIASNKIEDYKKLAIISAQIFKEYGALEIWETIADDSQHNFGSNSFRKATKLKDNQNVMLSWVVYRSREHREEVLNKVLADARYRKAFAPDSNQAVKEKDVFYGSFSSLVVR